MRSLIGASECNNKFRVFQTRNISYEEAKRTDLMGNISGSMIRNDEFDQMCDCAERIGIQLKLSYDEPPLMNFVIYPVKETCKSCLRRKSKNKDTESECWKNSGQVCYSGYIWDRKTPSKRGEGSEKS